MKASHSYTIDTLSREEFPPALLEIPQVPEKLFVAGELPNPSEYYYLSVVGSRKYTSYGKEVCERIISGLAGYPICIVSGLAMGIDGIAHRAALDAGLRTIAVPGSGLDQSVIYPRTHLGLAKEIIENGGTLLSEYEPDFRATPWSFPQRNRIMAGLSQGVLIIEAEEKSGTLITARMALDYNRNVFTVPGPIFSATSKGTNNLLRQGATPITSAKDLLEEIGFIEQQTGTLDLTLFTPEEQAIIILLDEPLAREDILASLDTPPAQTLSTLTVLEIKGVIHERMGKIERV
ncbi:MAG: processing protein DprA protein [Parcubacteria group bacterium GW2011_GWC1_42_11]|uniref:Processing protein DprA protein n=1 Tax=Candidatus Nomurabacteria bacterium GW2011_GWC2_42_20 TaxID=1618756 RepID=A0A0G1BPB9_9BACT|nr:MAG: processing protein DprA protein [Parcubacteria group bacterium GW2011_GWC1_42_11]KKS48106.1 MAG: processing protein DprA protein [Candidatus Nomurabacteria bacterium GW2011_GWC2_42_20]KKS58419.1 MAG: processing protein DprA protein [Candidatus Nomurabacteria bacterium GW2011_GWA2_42_41]KKT09223.1 MAG: processing protein DprA protein [Candidatus Nomurabacteria bacterium GW2011_GWB1_43_20]TAN36442.1 MAG: DNA-protecting protein DprA [Patescibacteria group bacterium]HBH71437.1 DNA-protecti